LQSPKLIQISDTPPAFIPHPLFRGGHMQTIGPQFLPKPTDPETGTCHIVDLRDGDQLAVVDDRPDAWRPGDRIVIVLHGLSGSHRSHYIVRMRNHFNEQPIRTFRIDMRGFGDSSLISRGHCNAGCYEDLDDVVRWANTLCESSAITLVGFSLGGNVLLQYLGRSPGDVPGEVDSAFAIAPPIDLTMCAWNLRRGLNRIYDLSFVRSLHRQLHLRRRKVPDLMDVDLKKLPGRLLQFDDQYTSIICGYDGAKDYYEKCSAAPLLKNVKIPTRILVAENDPVVPIKMFDKWPTSDAISISRTRCGGHLGYIDRQLSTQGGWLDRCLGNWILEL